MFLPRTVIQGALYEAVGLLDRTAISPPVSAGGNGATTATFLTVHDNETWEISRAVVACTSSSDTTATLYADDIQPSRILDASASGNLDTADNAAPLLVGPGETLLVVWQGASLGAVGTARVQGRLLRRRSG